MIFYSPIRIVIADDHPLFIEGFVSTINKKATDKIKIVGEANNGKELVDEVDQKKPDVVITDISMPVMDGLQASRYINQTYQNVGIIALTMHDDPELICEMFETGAKGYLIKNANYKEVIEAIETVYRGEMHYCSTSSTRLIKKIGPSKYNNYKKNNSISFCDIEIKIMKLICKQITTKEMADEMYMSTRTIEQYIHRIKEKIEAKNMVGIALYSIKNGIVGLHEI